LVQVESAGGRPCHPPRSRCWTSRGWSLRGSIPGTGRSWECAESYATAGPPVALGANSGYSLVQFVPSQTQVSVKVSLPPYMTVWECAASKAMTGLTRPQGNHLWSCCVQFGAVPGPGVVQRYVGHAVFLRTSRTFGARRRRPWRDRPAREDCFSGASCVQLKPVPGPGVVVENFRPVSPFGVRFAEIHRVSGKQDQPGCGRRPTPWCARPRGERRQPHVFLGSNLFPSHTQVSLYTMDIVWPRKTSVPPNITTAHAPDRKPWRGLRAREAKVCGKHLRPVGPIPHPGCRFVGRVAGTERASSQTGPL